ncbi:MAG: CotH kinase family protein [Planctomycetes bacterium]|nr:CotH kinase family protein [Planctomycetota bacterium]
MGLLASCAALLLVALQERSLAADLVITEVHQADPEFLELYNSADVDLDLKGYRLTGDLQHTFLKSLVVPPKGRVVLAQSVLEFKEHFGAEVLAGQTLVGCWGRIQNEGGVIQLHDPKGRVIDLACYGELVPGRSAVRISRTTLYQGRENWTLGLPTPGEVSPSQEAPPLLVDHTAHTPLAPRPSESVRVSCRVHGSRPTGGSLEWWGPQIPRQRVPLRFEPHSSRVTLAEADLPARPDRATVYYEWVLEGPSGTKRVSSDSVGGRSFSFYSATQPETALPCYSIEVSPQEMQSLRAQPERRRFAATLAIAEPGGELRPIGKVSLQARGRAVGRRWSKRSWVINLGSRRYRGMGGLVLRTSWRDPIGLRRVLGFDLYRRAKVLAPRARLVRVELNGEFFGLYTEVEPLERPFLLQNGLLDASLARPRNSRQDLSSLQCDGRTLSPPSLYEASWALDDPNTLGPLRSLLEGYEGAEDSIAFLGEHLDLESYLRYLAVTSLLHHWDSVNRNFVWCFDRLRKKWVVIPWDLDRTWGDHYEGLWLVGRAPLEIGTRARPIEWGGRRWWNRLRTRVFEQPELVKRLRAIQAELIESEFTAEKVGARARRLMKLAKPEILADAKRWANYTSRYDGRSVKKVRTADHIQRELGRLESFVVSRSRYLKSKSSTPAHSAAHVSLGDLLVLLGAGLGIAVYLARGGLRGGRAL